MRNVLRRQSNHLHHPSPDPQPNAIPIHRQVTQIPVRDGPLSAMPRRPRGWTPNLFFDQRDMQRSRPLAMNPSPLSNSTTANAAQRPDTSTGDPQIPNPQRNRPREQTQALAQRGISFVKDQHGSFQSIPSLMAPRAREPGIMESCVRRLGLTVRTVDAGAPVVQRRTSLGVLEMVGDVGLEFRLNDGSSRKITVNVWRGEERGRFGLYLDPSENSSQLFTPSGRRAASRAVDRPTPSTTDIATVTPASFGDLPALPSYDADTSRIATLPGLSGPMISGNTNLNGIPLGLMTAQLPAINGHDHLSLMGANMLDTIDVNQVFPPNTWGPLSMAVRLDDGSTEFATGTDGTLDLQNLVPGNFARLHRDHHFLAPDGFCPQCFDDAQEAADQ